MNIFVIYALFTGVCILVVSARVLNARYQHYREFSLKFYKMELMSIAIGIAYLIAGIIGIKGV